MPQPLAWVCRRSRRGGPNPGDLARETEPETWARSIFIPLADDVTPSSILNSIPTLILSNCLALQTYFTPRHKGLRIPGLFPYLVSVLRKGMLMASGRLNKTTGCPFATSHRLCTGGEFGEMFGIGVIWPELPVLILKRHYCINLV